MELFSSAINLDNEEETKNKIIIPFLIERAFSIEEISFETSFTSLSS